ncbi:DUF4192 domain-containing protein [Nocardia suismassiliense]|uniref:DUF4192 domain-containing protein n=1 Tax=Nocardia suismassiliense TaxID=2077092 RepID=UPI000D1D9D30|nr:DUF4192 domain-containing protein [Nocardia suismassiliense]
MPLPRFDPTGLIVSIPARLRYAPHRQLVIMLINTEMGPAGEDTDSLARTAIVAFDLTGDVERLVDAADQAARRIDASLAFVVVVDDRLIGPAHQPLPAPGIERTLAVLAAGLAAAGAPIMQVWATRHITPGSRWWSLTDIEDQGVLTDPSESPAAADRRAKGQTVFSSRQELMSAFDPDPDLSAAVETLLPAARIRAEAQRGRAMANDCWNSHYRRGLEFVLWCAADIAAGEDVPPQRLAELAMVLADQMVLDCLHATARSEYQPVVEQLWTLLLRSLTGPERAAPAALLAYSLSLRGDGPLALIAVTAALAADPHHFTSKLLYAVLNQPVPPSHLPTWSRLGAAAAEDLGVDLGTTDH